MPTNIKSHIYHIINDPRFNLIFIHIFLLFYYNVNYYFFLLIQNNRKKSKYIFIFLFKVLYYILITKLLVNQFRHCLRL